MEVEEEMRAEDLLMDPLVSRLVEVDPRWRCMIESGLEERARSEDLARRREHLERAACQARRYGDVERAARYFHGSDLITSIMRDECLDDPDVED